MEEHFIYFLNRMFHSPPLFGSSENDGYSFLIKRLNKVGIKVNFLRLIKAIYEKARLNAFS